MKTLQDISQIFEKVFKTRKDLELPAFLGDLNGNVKADNNHNVYVTLQASGEVRTVYNGKVPNVSRLPVIIGKGKTSGKFEVLRSRDVYVTPAFPDVAGHASLHTFPGVDTVPIRGEQFLPGLVIPASGLTVKVYGLAIQIAGDWVPLPTQTIDLSASVPASGALYVLLEFDNTGAVTITPGTGVDSREVLEYSDIPAETTNMFSLAAVKLYAGQTRFIYLPTDTDIIDLRFGKEKGAGGGGAPVTTAANDFQVGDGAGSWIKKTFAETIAILRTSLDFIYAAITHTHGSSEIVLATLKNPPADADSWLINDVAGGDVPKRVSFTVSRAYMRALFDTLYATITHAHAASDITSGTMATARLGSGTADSTTFLRGDNTWATPAGGGGSSDWQEVTETWTRRTQAYTNDPAAGNFITLNMTNTLGFNIGGQVNVSSSAGNEDTVVTGIVANTSITVRALSLNHTTSSPVVAALNSFTMASDESANPLYRKGMKVRYQDGGSDEYGMIGSNVASGGVTYITLIGTTDYEFSSSAITDTYVSDNALPEGFPSSFAFDSKFWADGSMTATVTATTFMQWSPVGLGYIASVGVVLTTGGSASAIIRSTLPFAPSALIDAPASALIRDAASGVLVSGNGGVATSTSGLYYTRSDSANWSLGTGRQARVSAFVPL